MENVLGIQMMVCKYAFALMEPPTFQTAVMVQTATRRHAQLSQSQFSLIKIASAFARKRKRVLLSVRPCVGPKRKLDVRQKGRYAEW
jgi:hypothetical protein